MSEEEVKNDPELNMEEREGNDEYMLELPEVAKRILIPCKKCEQDRYHVVTAQKTEKSVKVECETCKRKGTFRLKVKKKTTRKRKKTLTQEETWESLRIKIGIDKMSPYSMKSKFDVDTALDHKTFGLGFIVTVEAKKVEVCFKEYNKFLVHNRLN